MAKSKKTRNPHPTATPQDDLRARKKEAVIGSDRKKGGLLPIVMAVVLVAAIAGGYTLYTRSSDGPSADATAAVSPAAARPDAAAAADTVAYPVGLFEDGQARHFEFRDGERTIRYFVIRSADGVLRAAFDACDVCWPAGMGYEQEGDAMVCRNCGRKFASNLVNEVQGGCNPAPLTRKVENGMLLIQPEDIRGGAGYFDFKGKA